LGQWNTTYIHAKQACHQVDWQGQHSHHRQNKQCAIRLFTDEGRQFRRSQDSQAALESEKCNQRKSFGRGEPGAVKNSTASSEVIERGGWFGAK
jgi:hypothetical protein